MKNLLEPMDIEWAYVKHITLTTKHHCVLRDNRYGVQWEQITNRDGHGKVGRGKNYYFIDGDPREYTDLEVLCDKWNEKYDVDQKRIG